MNNYQLYRTNVLLSGQLKWDLIVESAQNTLYVSDFHLTPISENAPYTYKTDEYLIKNKHQYNVKDYYNKNKSDFYNACLDPKFVHTWPIICNRNEKLNTYSNIYDMGCRRTKHYTEYGKQFEFLCPIWLEKLAPTDVLSFKINIQNKDSKTTVGSNTLYLSGNTLYKFHNNFVKYLYNYLTDAGITNGCDDVINIDLYKDAYAIGLNVNSGLFETKNINNLISNITDRERPLMEVDNMIIQSFPDNSLICKQLFNFNICFNMEDIFSSHIVKMMYGENVIVSVTAYINDEQIELKDFYTEYEYIDKFVKSNTNETKNVLDYLNDNNYIEFVNKNKFCQSICHWALCENPDYIFNVYDGFSGLYIDTIEDGSKIIYENTHQYKNAPNTTLKKHNKQQNSCGWLTIFNTYIWSDFYKFIKNPDKFKLTGTLIGKSNYIHNIKYDYVPNLGDGLYIVGLNMPTNILAGVINSFENQYIRLFNKNIYILDMSNYNFILLLFDNMNNVSFAQFFKDLKNSYANNFNDISNLQSHQLVKTYLEELYKMLASKIDPHIIIFNKSLTYTKTKGPEITVNEIDYYKDDKAYNYVIRYDGKIKPSFTNIPNTLYYKDYISDDENSNSKLKHSIYSKYNFLNYEPLYPSIGFCAIKKLNDWTYNEYPSIHVSEHENENVYICGNEWEYSWFNNSHCLILNPNIVFKYNKLNSDTNDIDTIVHNLIRDYYKLTDNNLVSFIKNMYNYTNDWEYLQVLDTNTNELIDTTDNYIYTITLSLNFNKNN